MKRVLFTSLFLLIAFFSIAKTGINKTDAIIIGGIKQYITIKGDDTTKPLLLFLHGGPGGSLINTAGQFANKLQKHFIVVQWDQRETGRTKQLNPSTAPLTTNLLQDDTHELIKYLLTQFGKTKLYLAGFSWGTVLGFHIADKYPELLYAYIAISPVINQSESERMALAMLMQQAEQTGNEQESSELASVKIPFENSKQLFYARKWLFAFNGQPISNRDTTSMINYFANWSTTWLAIWNESLQKDLNKEIPAINCPVYFFVGRKDHQTNFSLTEQYYNKVAAAKKELYWFENSSHTIPDSEPVLLQDIIIEKILPETF